MASTSAVSMVMPLTYSATTNKRFLTSNSLFNPLPVGTSSSKAIGASSKPAARFVVQSSLKEKAVTALTAAALTASMVTPDIAEAASGVSPSLKNFLLSIGAGGAVLGLIVGAVIGVSNFDPVKRS